MEPAPIPSVVHTAPLAPQRAFTLIEMMVVLAIIAVLSVVVLISQSSFNKTLVLKDTAYSVEYAIREAQTYGVSSLRVGATTDVAYGINFNTSTPSQYTFFADTNNAYGLPGTWCIVGTAGQPDSKPGDCRYKPGADTLITTTKFTRGFTISSFCAKDTNSKLYCTTDASTPLQSLDIVFARPSPSAIMTASTSIALIPNQIACAVIVLTAPTGNATTSIRVLQYGNMSIGQSTCP